MTLQNVRGRDVLSAIFDPCDLGGFVDVRFLGSGVHQTFVPVADLPEIGRLCQRHAMLDAYFGVALRDGAGGDIRHCVQSAVLHVDIDGSVDTERLRACVFPPSVIVSSGGGLHCYWLMREAFALPMDADRVKGLDRRLALTVGGDLASAEPARILRIPGTRNRKYQPPRSVAVVEFNPESRYNPSDFEEWLPPDTAVIPGRPTWNLAEKLPVGQRNGALYRLVRTLMLKELPVNVIDTVIRTVNSAHAEQPLGEDEVSALIDHALRQPNRPPAFPRVRLEVAADVR